jgi:hypothetical protein
MMASAYILNITGSNGPQNHFPARDGPAPSIRSPHSTPLSPIVSGMMNSSPILPTIRLEWIGTGFYSGALPPMKPCRECRREISEQALACPQCGAPYPSRETWDGWGYEYKSRLMIAGLPLVHISFKYRPNRVPVVARGIIAIGQFGCGIVCIAQFGVGMVCVSQFAIAGFALAQFAVAYSLIAQFGVFVAEGRGQLVRQLSALLGMS